MEEDYGNYSSARGRRPPLRNAKVMGVVWIDRGRLLVPFGCSFRMGGGLVSSPPPPEYYLVLFSFDLV